MSFVSLTDPYKISDKVLSERETRKRLLTHAKMVGCYYDMLQLFAKYDKLLRNCTDEKERQDIAKLGATRMFLLLGRGTGQLTVNGEVVFDDGAPKGLLV